MQSLYMTTYACSAYTCVCTHRSDQCIAVDVRRVIQDIGIKLVIKVFQSYTFRVQLYVYHEIESMRYIQFRINNKLEVAMGHEIESMVSVHNLPCIRVSHVIHDRDHHQLCTYVYILYA